MFILRDHDVQNADIESIVYVAHSLFNAILPEESLESEMAEYRNFQPLDYWITLLEKHGCKAGSERLLQKGDPTLNTMLSFTKVMTVEEEQDAVISQDLRKDQTYQRDFIQGHLSGPEWVNVDISQEYARFIEHTPFYEFPYFKSIASYWDLFGKSWQAAAEKKGQLSVLTSDYTMMNLFVGASMTLEYAAKGIISWPIQKMYQGQEALTIKMLVHDPMQEIEHVGGNIKIIKKYADAGLVCIEVPRYKEFLNIIKKLITTHMVIQEVAGQKEILIKVRYKDGAQVSAEDYVKKYEWVLPTQVGYTYAILVAQVNKLTEIFKQLDMHNIEIMHIHDY